MAQNEPSGIVVLAAQTQQILVQALRQIQFAAERMIDGLRKGNMKKLGGGIQLLPQLPYAGIDMVCFRRRLTFHCD
jgi:hypothetical protein